MVLLLCLALWQRKILSISAATISTAKRKMAYRHAHRSKTSMLKLQKERLEGISKLGKATKYDVLTYFNLMLCMSWGGQ